MCAAGIATMVAGSVGLARQSWYARRADLGFMQCRVQ